MSGLRHKNIDYGGFVKEEADKMQREGNKGNTQFHKFCKETNVATHDRLRRFLEHQLHNVARVFRGATCWSEDICTLIALIAQYESLENDIDASDTNKVVEMIELAYRDVHYYPRHLLDKLLQQICRDLTKQRTNTTQVRFSKTLVWVANLLIANAQAKLAKPAAEATQELWVFMESLPKESTCTFMYLFAGEHLSHLSKDIPDLELYPGSCAASANQIPTVDMGPKPVVSDHNLELIVTIVDGYFDKESKPRNCRKGFPDGTCNFRFWLHVKARFDGTRAWAFWSDVFDAMVALEEKYPAFYENAAGFAGFPGVEIIRAQYARHAGHKVYFKLGKAGENGKRTADRLHIHIVARISAHPIYVYVPSLDILLPNPKMIPTANLTGRIPDVPCSTHPITEGTFLGLAEQHFTSTRCYNARTPPPLWKVCSGSPKEPTKGSDGKGGEKFTHRQLLEAWRELCGLYAHVYDMYELCDKTWQFWVNQVSLSCGVTTAAALTLLSNPAAQQVLKVDVPDGMSNEEVCDIFKDCGLLVKDEQQGNLPMRNLAIEGAPAEADEAIEGAAAEADAAEPQTQHRNKRLKTILALSSDDETKQVVPPGQGAHVEGTAACPICL